MKPQTIFTSLFEHSYRGNIPKIFAYHALLNFFLFLPFWVIYLQDRLGLTLTQITLVDVAFWFSMTLTEIPTGAVADTYGRRISIIWGILIIATASVFFALAPNFWWMMIANSLWSLGFTFDSGATMSLLYDSMKQLDREEDYTRVRGYLSAVGLASVGVSALVGGMIAEQSLQMTFLIYAALVLVGLFFVLGMVEPPFEPDPDTGLRIAYFKAVGLAFGTIFKTPNLRNVILYDNILPLSVVSVGALFIQPHAQSLGMSLFLIGALSFWLRLSRTLGAAASGNIIAWVGKWRWLWIAPILVFLGTLLMGVIPSVLGIVLFFIAGFAHSATYPLDESLILKYTPGPVRATILSINALVLTLFISIFEPGLGWLADQRGLPFTFIVMAFVIFIPLIVVLFVWRKTWDDDPQAGRNDANTMSEPNSS